MIIIYFLLKKGKQKYWNLWKRFQTSKMIGNSIFLLFIISILANNYSIRNRILHSSEFYAHSIIWPKIFSVIHSSFASLSRRSFPRNWKRTKSKTRMLRFAQHSCFASPPSVALSLLIQGYTLFLEKKQRILRSRTANRRFAGLVLFFCLLSFFPSLRLLLFLLQNFVPKFISKNKSRRRKPPARPSQENQRSWSLPTELRGGTRPADLIICTKLLAEMSCKPVISRLSTLLAEICMKLEKQLENCPTVKC